MALLGCPRGHTVPGETLRLTHCRILTLEPERSVTGGQHDWESRVPMAWRAQAACGFSRSASKASPFFQTLSVIAAILRAKVSRAIAGSRPLASSPS